MSQLPTIQNSNCIGIFAPAGCISKNKIETGLRVLRSRGFLLKKSPHLYGKNRYYSGSIDERVSDIHLLLDDPQVSILYAVRGGVGCSQLLPFIDYLKWKNTKKLLIGFSDVTALQMALFSTTGLPSLSGMTLTSQLYMHNPHLELFFNILSGNQNTINLNDLVTDVMDIHQEGEASGLLIGGTLSIINSLLGTPFFPDLGSIILFIEDVNEPLYRIERNFVQLKLAGVLEKVSGLILGIFKQNQHKLEVWPTIKYLFPSKIPVVSGFPYGHEKDISPLPLGIHVEFQAQPFKIKW
jgi:muramoyltetrapeptide carboxypeptidase